MELSREETQEKLNHIFLIFMERKVPIEIVTKYICAMNIIGMIDPCMVELFLDSVPIISVDEFEELCKIAKYIVDKNISDDKLREYIAVMNSMKLVNFLTFCTAVEMIPNASAEDFKEIIKILMIASSKRISIALTIKYVDVMRSVDFVVACMFDLITDILPNAEPDEFKEILYIFNSAHWRNLSIKETCKYVKIMIACKMHVSVAFEIIFKVHPTISIPDFAFLIQCMVIAISKELSLLIMMEMTKYMMEKQVFDANVFCELATGNNATVESFKVALDAWIADRDSKRSLAAPVA